MPKRYAPEDIERGLTALVVTGNSQKAAELTGYGDRTIRKWHKSHAARFQAIEAKRAHLIDQACIEEFRAIVLDGARATRSAIAAAQQDINNGNTRDPAATARNLATASAIAADKVALMEGRPTSIVEHRNPDDIIKRLEALGLVVDAEAEELDAHDESQAQLGPARAETNVSELAA